MTERLEDRGDFIHGHFESASQPEGELDIRSPADHADRTAALPYAASQLERAVDAATDAAPGWRSEGLDGRRAHLRRYAQRLDAHREDIAHAIAREVGKPLWEARIEAGAMVSKVELMLTEGARYTQGHRVDSLPGEVRYLPLGVLGIIGPFNFPGHLPNGQIVPALLLGNTVVHKPSERTPTTANWMAQCGQEAGLPAGVFNVVQGPGPLGQRLVEHRGVDGILFTGSAAVGKRILAATADTPGKLVALELGGKNASIALDDCDLEHTARTLAFAAFATAGQRCTSTSRLIVTRARAEGLIARLTELAASLTVGHPFDPDIFMGPVISEEARQRLWAGQAAAREAGFEARAAGGALEVPGHQGFYVRPAIHVAPSPRAQAPGYVDHELFGPDLAIHVVQDLEEAIEVANDSRFGLAAAVFSASTRSFERAADTLRVGVVHHNRATAGASGRLPFGGIGDSGNHRPAGILTGLSCSFPQGRFEAPELPPDPPDWPGLNPSGT